MLLPSHTFENSASNTKWYKENSKYQDLLVDIELILALLALNTATLLIKKIAQKRAIKFSLQHKIRS